MRATQHSSNTRVLGAPEGWDQEELPCSALPITEGNYDGHPVITSFWRPSPEDLVALNEGKLLQLNVMSNVMPPVSIHVEP